MPKLRFKDCLVIRGSIVLITLSLLLAHVGPVGGASGPSVTVVNTMANPVPVTWNATFTHVGQKASRDVVLQFLPGCSCFKRIFPDGSIDNAAFGIQAGQVLVVMDVDWSLTGGVGGQTASMILAFGPAVIFDSRATFNTDGISGRSEHLTGGRVVSVLPTPIFEKTLNNLVLSGYLAPDK